MTSHSCTGGPRCIHIMTFLCLALGWHGGLAAEAPERQPALAEAAANLERAGRKVEAIAVYEQLAKQDPLARRVVANRLARLYAETGNETAALMWAREVTMNHPDPEAYLAGIHALCGSHAEAASILTKALEAKPLPRTRELALRWQLADVLAAQGKLPEAEEQLRKALALAQGHPEEPTAEKRLNALREKVQSGV